MHIYKNQIACFLNTFRTNDQLLCRWRLNKHIINGHKIHSVSVKPFTITQFEPTCNTQNDIQAVSFTLVLKIAI